MISERERELAEALDFDQAKPYYADGETPNVNVINFAKPTKQ